MQTPARNTSTYIDLIKDSYIQNSLTDVLKNSYLGTGEKLEDGLNFSRSKTADIGIGIVGTYDLNNLNSSGIPNDFSYGSVGGGTWWNFTASLTHTFGGEK